jgi:hypothetical protein
MNECRMLLLVLRGLWLYLVHIYMTLGHSTKDCQERNGTLKTKAQAMKNNIQAQLPQASVD